MAGPYSITITNGSGQKNIMNGSYDVTASVNGYVNTTINPNTATVIEGTNTYSYQISADGTLTLHVTVEGTSGGTAIVGAKFRRCNLAGDTDYGSEITTDASGNADFGYVPYGTGAQTIYYRQTASDGEHSFSTAVRNITLTNQTESAQISNPLPAQRTINLTDAHYSGLPIDSGTITFTEQ